MNNQRQIIPTFSLARQVKNQRASLLSALEKVLDSQQFVGGTFIETFEKQLAAYLNVQHVVSCNSGTDALWMALHALELPKNSLVLTTPFSFIASSSEIVAHEAHPIFIDIELDTFNIDPQLIAAWLAKEALLKNGQAFHRSTGFPIVGILPVDLFGQTADYSALQAIAQQWNLWIIEDCAQALGATYQGKKSGTLGTIGTLSFYPTKNLGAFGDAGCCVTNDPTLAERLAEIRHHGRKKNYEYLSLGINSRMDAFHAAILSEKLTHLDGWNERRHEIAQRYHAGLKKHPFIRIPHEKVGTHVFHQYSIVIECPQDTNIRDTLEKYLLDCGVQTRIFYPQTLPSINFLRTHQALTTLCPVAEYVSRNILSLPLWPELENQEVDYVIECIHEFPAFKNTQLIQKQNTTP